MKKHIIAAAVAAAVTAPAMAQNVTIYGLLDQAYQTNKQSARDLAKDQKATYVGAGAIAGSRIGFRGTEDLGGGTRAEFVYEQGFEPSLRDGANVRNNGAYAPLQNSGKDSYTDKAPDIIRQAYVGISNTNLGTIRAGRVYGMTYDMVTFNGYTITENPGSKQASTALALRVRGIQYHLPTINGINVSLAYGGANENVIKLDSTDFGNNSALYQDRKSEYLGARAMWAQGPAKLAFAYESLKEACAAPNSTAALTNIYGGAIAQASCGSSLLSSAKQDTKNSGSTVAGAYNFGVAEVMGVYGQAKLQSLTSGQKTKQTLWQAGVKVPLTAQASLGALYFDRKSDNDPQDTRALTTKGSFFMAKYDLSKRTSAYAFTGQEKESAAADSSTAKVVRSGLGLFHSF